jgi:AAA+ ATPase superfamily predicted ATPase
VGFVNRADKITALQAWWERPNARPALVWGRRRVGKTALLQHFATVTDAPVVFHKAAALTRDTDELTYVVCARDAVEHPDTQTRAVTAADIFTA